MKSALETQPKLKPDVTIVRREHLGKVRYVVKEPSEQKYYQFGETEVQLMRLMDGNRTPADIADAAAENLDGRPDPGQIADFVQRLKRLRIVERTPAESHMILLEHVRAQRKVRARGRAKGSILRLRFSLGDPDQLFEKIVQRIRWMWTPSFVAFSLGLFTIYAVILVKNWDQFWAATENLYTFSGFSGWDYVLLYGLFLLIGIIHEFGHGFTTKAFGGEVREIGGMFLYFSPALYCNTNDAWTFQRRSQRLWVNFAGPWIQLIIASLAAIVWVVTEPGTFINKVAFFTFVAGGVLSVLLNLNPLLPLDGYYALSDWLEIPNLRRRSFEYWSWIGKRYLMGIDVAPPPTTPRERRVFIIYGALAMVYSGLIIALSLFFLIVVQAFGPVVSWALAILLGFALVKSWLGRSQAIMTAAATTWKAGFLRGRWTAPALAVVALMIVLPFVLPWTFRAKGNLVVEAYPRALVRAGAAGVLDEWHVQEGEFVEVGEPIATLWNPDLEARYVAYRGRADRLRVERSRAEARGDLAAAAAARSVLEEVERQLAVVQARREQLVIRSPISGVVLGYRLYERLGAALEEGDHLLDVAGHESRVARIRIPQDHAGELAIGQPVSIKLHPRPDLEFQSVVFGVAPAAQDGWVEVTALVPSGEWQPDPGMLGIAKVATRKVTVAKAIARAFRRNVRVDLWL